MRIHQYKTTSVSVPRACSGSSDHPSLQIWLGGTALCDIIIAASMLYYLHKTKTSFKRTATLLSRVVSVTVETGLICATFAILALVFFVTFKEITYHLTPSITLSKLYSNSLLAVCHLSNSTYIISSLTANWSTSVGDIITHQVQLVDQELFTESNDHIQRE